jgi:hypothetical protein
VLVLKKSSQNFLCREMILKGLFQVAEFNFNDPKSIILALNAINLIFFASLIFEYSGLPRNL